MKKIALMARIKQTDGSYTFQRLTTVDKKGKPIQPMQPENACHYYFRFTEKLPGEKRGKQVMRSAGTDFAEAIKQLRAKEIELECEARGVAAPALVENRLTMAEAAERFHTKQVALGKSPATVYSYKRAVEQFRESCFKTFMDEITQRDIIEHIEWLRRHVPSRKHGQRNGMLRARLQYLTIFFGDFGMKNPLPMKEWPKLEERRVEAYTSEEIAMLLSKATPDEYDLILFFLCTGFRDDEAAHAVYSDVDFRNHLVKTGPKPDIGFTTKNGRERTVRVPTELIDRLRERREREVPPANGLIFPNSNGRPDSTLLARVRKAAKRAGHTGRVTLHQFRRTFGTRYAEKHGVVNAQHLLGHASIVTTQKYLAETKIARSSVEALFEDVVGK
jgi:integrase